MVQLKELLIVSPHFPPINAPDHQRVRMAAPYFASFGWRARVLAVAPDKVEGIRDPLQEQSLPPELEVHYSGAIPPGWTRRLGFGGLGWRALPSLLRTGTALIRSRPPAAVLFSTTVFPSLILGPLWKRRFGIPYLVDLQDPWRSDYYETTGVTPPGGRFKYGVAQLYARLFEPTVIKNAAHIISVSAGYEAMLKRRYDLTLGPRVTVLPFAASERDFEVAAGPDVAQSVFSNRDGLLHFVYTGRVGDDMQFALRSLCAALAAARKSDPARWGRVRFHFIGTTYNVFDSSRPIEHTAAEYGVADLVMESPQRVGYFESLRLMLDSAGLLVFGSDDAAYSPSKLYPTLFARRPILAVTPPGSYPETLLSRAQAAVIAPVVPNDSEAVRTSAVEPALHTFLSLAEGSESRDHGQLLEQFSARTMTATLCGLLDEVVG